MSVPPTTMRTTRSCSLLLSFGPLRVTLPVQLPFRLVSPLSSLPRARKSSTTGTFYERDRHVAWTRTACSLMVEVRDRTPARLPPPPHLDVPHMGPSHPTLHLDCARSRACPVPLGTAQTASSSQRTVPPAGTTSRRSARSRRASRQSRAPRRASRSSFSQLGGTLKINEIRVCWSFATDVRVM